MIQTCVWVYCSRWLLVIHIYSYPFIGIPNVIVFFAKLKCCVISVVLWTFLLETQVSLVCLTWMSVVKVTLLKIVDFVAKRSMRANHSHSFRTPALAFGTSCLVTLKPFNFPLRFYCSLTPIQCHSGCVSSWTEASRILHQVKTSFSLFPRPSSLSLYLLLLCATQIYHHVRLGNFNFALQFSIFFY